MDNLPTVVPILSAGQHRTPQQGGCFMEIAALLAGERWSDHPGCTHPVLAAVARAVNDRTGDAGRAELAPLIPWVIGTATSDPRLGPLLVARCVRAALEAGTSQQREELARALRTAEQLVAGGRQWLGTRRSYLHTAAPRAVNRAVSCLATATEPESDGALRALLLVAIVDARALCGLEPGGLEGSPERGLSSGIAWGAASGALSEPSWGTACALVGATAIGGE